MESTKMMIWRITPKYYKILHSEYTLNGSANTSMWSVSDAEFDRECLDLTHGSKVLFVIGENGHDYIVGGSFFTRWTYFDIDSVWASYGVRNGVYSREDFLEEIKARGGDEKSRLSLAHLTCNFIFHQEEWIQIPDECFPELRSRQHYLVSLSEPSGRYLNTLVLRARQAYLENYGMDWPGMFYTVSHRNSSSYMASFRARVTAAYNFQCALTGCNVNPALTVAHIQPFYDDKFQHVRNGILFRSDIYSLFKQGHMTVFYKGDKLITHFSKTISVLWGVKSGYEKFEGKALTLPDDKDCWPDRGYIEWHIKYCFEHWQHMSGTSV